MGVEGRTEGLFEVDLDVFEECEGDWENKSVFSVPRHDNDAVRSCLVGAGGGVV